MKTGTDSELKDTANTKASQLDAEETKTPPFSNYRRILAFGTRIEHAGILVAIACAAASGVAFPLMNIVFGNLTADFTEYFLPGNNVTEQQFKHQVSQATLYIVYLFIGKFFLSYVSLFCFRTTGLRISAALRLAYMQSLFSQPIRKLDQVSAGTVTSTITTASNTIQVSISDRLHLLFQSLSLMISAYAIAFRYSWALTLATSSALLFMLCVFGVTAPRLLKIEKQMGETDAKHATVAAEVISSIRTVFSLGAQIRLTRKHSKWVEEAHKQGLKQAPWFASQMAFMFFALYAVYALAFWFGLKLFREGHIGNVGTVIM
ncbi:hypothetical protein LTS08_003613 [Lithohypha guttulata]|nr:hypothetical protein LTS08_003613 [Lithohypha guttulata]